MRFIASGNASNSAEFEFAGEENPRSWNAFPDICSAILLLSPPVLPAGAGAWIPEKHLKELEGKHGIGNLEGMHGTLAAANLPTCLNTFILILLACDLFFFFFILFVLKKKSPVRTHTAVPH
jgi:hypothetical protein